MKNFARIAIFILTPFVFLTWVPAVSAATLFFSAPTTTVSIGEEFSVNILVDSGDRGFNAAEAAIIFPNDVLEVTSVDAAPSSTVFNFWLVVPSFSNEKGVVSFSGGTTRGVVGSAIQVLSFRVRAKGSGEALITASDASINASDGSGTNILDSIKALSVVVSKAAAAISAKTTQRIMVTEAAVTIPHRQSEPVSEPTNAAAGETATTTEAKTTAESDACTGLFVGCELRFPAIGLVSMSLHEQVGADLFVSGTASDGTHVHLLLRRDDVPYKEITAIVKPDGTWEGSLTNIYAYGTYALAAWAENEDSSRRSQSVTRENIDVYPPFTLHPFGYVLRWYAIATAAFGVLVGFLGTLLAWRYLVRREGYRMNLITVAFGIATFAFVGMFTAAYILWQKEYSSKVPFWKDTDIRCILRAPSYMDVHNSVQLSIYIDNKPQPIPAEIGLSPVCVAQIHTLDTTGRIHIKSMGRPMMLTDFFTVAGISFQQEGYIPSVIINGKDYTDRIDSYALKNGDGIVVTYTSAPPAKDK